jgi:hypothetical protein
MATTVVDFREPLPQVCARCGASATVKVERLLHHKEGASLLPAIFFLGFWGWVYAKTTPRREGWLVLDLPFCEAHKHGWRSKERVGWITLTTVPLLFLVAGLICGMNLASLILSTFIFGGLAAAFAAFWLSVLFEFFTVRVKTLDPTMIQLRGVAKEFDDQLVELRRVRSLAAPASPSPDVPMASPVPTDENPWQGLSSDPFEKLS